jgi:cell division initiation protein
MDISAKVLREVEFRDRLRGYDTDEVDDFLERAAVGFDELLAQLQVANDRADRAERQAAEMPIGDDESIKRTLVLAQRTADLAVKEAQAEADAMLSEARAAAAAMLAEARESAERTRSSAEQGLQTKIDTMESEHARLESEIATLVGLVESEQSRLANSLRTMLGYIEELSPAPAIRSATPSGASTPYVAPSVTQSAPYSSSEPALGVSAPAPTPATTPLFPDDDDADAAELDDGLDFPLVDVERQVTEDANRAGAPTAFRDRIVDPLDPDEALWDRWARMGDGDTEEEV